MTLHVDLIGNGPDLVLLHGWGMHSGGWEETLPALARHFRVHAIDLPGHGYSARFPVSDFDAAAADVAAVIPDRSILCGWSLGGLVAQRIARKHRTKVRALALVATTPCFTERSDWPHAMKAATLEEFAAGLRDDRDATLKKFVRLNALNGARGRDAIRAFSRQLGERDAPRVEALQATLRWLRDTDLRQDAPALDVPALVMHGTRDALAPIEAGRWLANHLPAARLIEWPDAAHLPFFTHRDAFVKSLESFVA
ncbi:MAG: pimeloyl-ACP methyl ester esterase BioH [Usitatibacter sp.]